LYGVWFRRFRTWTAWLPALDSALFTLFDVIRLLVGLLRSGVYAGARFAPPVCFCHRANSCLPLYFFHRLLRAAFIYGLDAVPHTVALGRSRMKKLFEKAAT
jgi:hypothetical protein